MFLENLSFLLPANSWVWAFLFFMTFLAIVDFVTFWPRRWQHRDFKSWIVSVGILGTFTGVAMGLWEFDSSNVEMSIPPLLEGLKTAFQTSIFGMGLAVLIAVIQKLKPQYSEDESRSEKQSLAELLEHAEKQSNSLAELLTQLSGQRKELREHADKQSNSSAELLTQLSGQREELREHAEKQSNSSAELLTQLSEQRKELRENAEKNRNLIEEEFKHTNKTLDDALIKISEGASKEIIAALNKTIERFNEDLTKQFGENFEQLNAACLKLVEWQQQHKESVEATHKQLQDSVSALSQMEKSFGTIAERNQEVLDVYEQLSKIITAYDNQANALTQHLEKYGDLANKAGKMFGDADERFKNIADQINSFAVDFRSKIGEQSESIKSMLDDSQRQITDSVKHSGESISKAAKEMSELYGVVTSNINKTAEDLQSTVNNQSQAITEINKQLTEGLNQMEKALISITEKMGEKYKDFMDGAEIIADMVNRERNRR